MAAVAMSVALPMSAAAQRADGAIGVSLVIAPPVEIMTAAITELWVDRDGIVSIRSTRRAADSPVTGRVSSRRAGSSGNFFRERYGRAELVERAKLVERAEPVEIRVRRKLLVVAGT